MVAGEEERQRRSYRRATLFVVMVALIGGGWIALAAFSVFKLERRANGLKAKAEELQQTSSKLEEKIASQREDLERKEAELVEKKADLLEIETKLIQGKTQEALRLVSTSITERKPKGPDSQETSAPGFVGSYDYRGPDKTVISVEVIPDGALLQSPRRPNSLYTYALNGKNYFTPPPGNTILVFLDKTKGNSVSLDLLLDFVVGEKGGYTIKQTASAGANRRSTLAVRPSNNGSSKTLTFVYTLN